MATYEVRSLKCSSCGQKLVWGYRRFGPARVRCGRCGTVLATRLPDWKGELPGPRETRTWWMLSELLSPSWTGSPGVIGFLFSLLAFSVFPAALIPVVLSLQASAPEAMVDAAAALALLIYPAFLVARLVRMAREASSYSRTQEPPIWPWRLARSRRKRDQAQHAANVAHIHDYFERAKNPKPPAN
jgi:hypothetical protein